MHNKIQRGDETKVAENYDLLQQNFFLLILTTTNSQLQIRK
jgi:hypothetical protein